ncbi:hypothetical protein Tco_0744280 [Tanacetum coccineum]
MLSIDGRTTLVSSVLGALGIYNLLLSLYRIGSLQALNLSLIQKWRWRYVHNHHALWVKVVSSIHGHSNDGICFSKLHKNTMWARIIDSVKAMHEKGIILHSNMRRKLNNGVSIKLWHDIWIGDCSLKTRFPRLFCLDTDPHCLIQALYDLLHNSRVCDTPDVWEWTIRGFNSFSVKETRIHIDNIILPDVHIPTRWIQHIDHILWNCPLAVEIWHRVFLLLDISFPVINSFAASFEWLEDLQITR